MDSTSDSCHYQSNLNNWWCLRLWFSKCQSLSTTTAFFGTSLEQMNQTTKFTSSAVHVLLYSRHWLTYEHTFWCFKKTVEQQNTGPLINLSFNQSVQPSSSKHADEVDLSGSVFCSCSQKTARNIRTVW